jgi:RNA polymerase sigma-70 factor, ECF subfamily
MISAAVKDEPLSGSATSSPGKDLDAERLVREAQAGSAEALATLVEKFHRRIFNYLCQLTRNTHDAEDLCQTTFLKAFRNLGAFHSPHSFAPWLFTIAKRSALNHFRAARPFDEIEDNIASDLLSPADSLAKSEERQGIWLLAEKLPPQQSEALWLRYGEGFSIKETAAVMGTNQLRIRVLLHRARTRLGEWIEQDRRHHS